MRKHGATIFCILLCAMAGAGMWTDGRIHAGTPEYKYTPVQTEPTISPEENSTDVGSGDDRTGAWSMEDGANGEKVFSVDGTPLAPQVTELTQEELYSAVGTFLPGNAPDGFAFESASLGEYGYFALWSRGLEELNWRIRDYRDEDAQRITAVADTRNYDLARYPIPRADSVPEELREIVDNPIFRAEDLTLEAVYARAYKVSELGDSNGYRMQFSVLYGDKIISVSSKGVSPDWLFEQLSECFG